MPSVPSIKPLIIENLVIKARKMVSEPKLRKKRKTEAEPDSGGSKDSEPKAKEEEENSLP
jgi:hypothetical protein